MHAHSHVVLHGLAAAVRPPVRPAHEGDTQHAHQESVLQYPGVGGDVFQAGRPLEQQLGQPAIAGWSTLCWVGGCVVPPTTTGLISVELRPRALWAGHMPLFCICKFYHGSQPRSWALWADLACAPPHCGPPEPVVGQWVGHMVSHHHGGVRAVLCFRSGVEHGFRDRLCSLFRRSIQHRGTSDTIAMHCPRDVRSYSERVFVERTCGQIVGPARIPHTHTPITTRRVVHPSTLRLNHSSHTTAQHA
jgi:hypothetical protein